MRRSARWTARGFPTPDSFSLTFESENGCQPRTQRRDVVPAREVLGRETVYPPGRRTRKVSATKPSVSGRCSITWLLQTMSNDSSSYGSDPFRSRVRTSTPRVGGELARAPRRSRFRVGSPLPIGGAEASRQRRRRRSRGRAARCRPSPGSSRRDDVLDVCFHRTAERVVGPVAEAIPHLRHRREAPCLEVVDDRVRRGVCRELGPSPIPRRSSEEVADDVEVEPREDDVLAEALSPLGLHPVNEARVVEVVALLLAPARVGEEEPAPAQERDEREEREARDPAAGSSRSPRGRACRIAASVTGWSTKRSGIRRACSASSVERAAEQLAVVEQLVAVDADDAERLVRDVDRRREVVGHQLRGCRGSCSSRCRRSCRGGRFEAAQLTRARSGCGRASTRRAGSAPPGTGCASRSCAGRPRCGRRRCGASGPSPRRAPSSSCRRGRARAAARARSEARASKPPPVAGEAREHGRQPAGHVRVRPQVAAARARGRARGPGSGSSSCSSERRDLLDLLRRGRAEVVVAALAQPGQHRGELDQLARRPVDDEDHLRRRLRGHE